MNYRSDANDNRSHGKHVGLSFTYKIDLELIETLFFEGKEIFAHYIKLVRTFRDKRV
jgi:hypothetical protein